jgi:hypothetical protein
VPITTIGGVVPFHVQAFANPLVLDGSTYKDFRCETITGDTTINLTGVIDGDSGMIEIIIENETDYMTDEDGVIITDEDGEEIVVTNSVHMGTMFTKQLGPVDIDMTANADNIISWRKVGTDIVYTVSQIGVESELPVTRIGNPLVDQVAVWNSDGILRGSADFKFDGDIFTFMGGICRTPTNISTTPYTVLATDALIYVDATAEGIIVNLPPATGSGRILIIKKIAGAIGNVVTVTADVTGVADNIDGNPTVELAVLYTSLTIQDGIANNWYIN